MLSTSAAVALGGVLLAGSLPAAGPTPVLRLTDPRLDESSGLAASVRHDGVLWTHNDGGSRARVMAVDRRGRTTATVTLRGIDPFDPEALAPGRDPAGRPALLLGDIGDNDAVRPDVSVFRFTEPRRLADQTVTATWFRLAYPDGPRDAEALLVGPRDGRVWIAAKDIFGAGLYRAPARLRTDRVNRLERVGAVPGLVTDGAFLPDGRFVLRTYSAAYLYDRPDHVVARASLPDQEQGESLAVDGDRLVVGSEGRDSPVYSVPVPGSTRPESPSPAATQPGSAQPGSAQPGATPSGRPEVTAADRLRDRLDAGRGRLLAALAVGVGLAAIAAAAVGRASRRRRARR